MDESTAAAWIGIIPTLVALALVVGAAVVFRQQLAGFAQRVDSVTVGAVTISAAVAQDLAEAPGRPPIASAGLTALEQRVRRNAEVIAGTRLLWVDDRPEGNRAERRYLRAAGFHIATAVTTEEGLDALRRDDVDIVVTDMVRGADAKAGIELRARAGEAEAEHLDFVLYTGTVDAGRPVPAGFVGLTNRPDDLVHLLIDRAERREAAS